MKAENLTYFDGHWYKPGDEVPDLGSFVAMPGSDKVRNYSGLSRDVHKLPKYSDLMTGSSALCIDTGQLFNYESTTKTWYEL